VCIKVLLWTNLVRFESIKSVHIKAELWFANIFISNHARV